MSDNNQNQFRHEKEIIYLKHRYNVLLLDKNSYTHDLNSILSQKSENLKKEYKIKIAEAEKHIQSVTSRLQDLGCSLVNGKWR